VAGALLGGGFLSAHTDDDPAADDSGPRERVHKPSPRARPADPVPAATDHASSSAPPASRTATSTTTDPTPSASSARAAAPPTSVRTVILRIESIPIGAAVEDATTGERLGETPHELEIPAGAPRPRLRIVYAGYDPSEVAPATDRSDTTSVRLKRKTAAKAPRTATWGSASARTARGVD
jgi:hypothetical protein